MVASGPIIGRLHGPGNVSRVPEGMHRLAGLVTPLPTSAGSLDPLGPANGTLSPGVSATSALDTSDVPSESLIRFVVVAAVCGKPELLRHLIDNYCMPDVEFVHFAGSTRGRDNYYHVLRMASGIIHYDLAFRDIICANLKACVWVDLKVRPRGLPLALFSARRVVPCLVILHFARDPADGRLKLTLQHDHHSLYLLSWLGGLWSAQVMESVVRPLMGWAIVVQGWLLDQAAALIPRVISVFRAEDGHAASRKASAVSSRPLFGPAPAPLAAYFAESDPGSSRMSADTAAAPGPCYTQDPNILAQMRRITAEVAKGMVEEEDVSEIARRGFIGKVLQPVLGVLGIMAMLSLMLGMALVINNLVPLP